MASTQLSIPRISPYGERGLMIELGGSEDVHRAYVALRDGDVPGIVDLVPAARSLLVRVDVGGVGVPEVRRALAASLEPQPATGHGKLVEIPVVYDGADLEEVAALTGTSVDEVIRRHSEPEYVAAFCGFVPGFAYLTGLDERLCVRRLASPRVRVPAGSVAIADQYTAVYPTQSPGGWRLIGRTDVTLFDVERDEPALIAPTYRVRFRSVPG